MDIDQGNVMAMLAFVVGGILSVLRHFLHSEKEIRRDTSLIRGQLVEGASLKLVALLRKFRETLDLSEYELRGDGREHPDLVGEYTTEIIKTTNILDGIESALRQVHICFIALIVSTLSGIVLTVVSLFSILSIAQTTIVASILLGVQIVAFLLAYISASKIDSHDKQ